MKNVAYLLDDQQLKDLLQTSKLAGYTCRLFLEGFNCDLNLEQSHANYSGYAKAIRWIEDDVSNMDTILKLVEKYFYHSTYHLALFEDDKLAKVYKNIHLEDVACETIRPSQVILHGPRAFAKEG